MFCHWSQCLRHHPSWWGHTIKGAHKLCVCLFRKLLHEKCAFSLDEGNFQMTGIQDRLMPCALLCPKVFITLSLISVPLLDGEGSARLDTLMPVGRDIVTHQLPTFTTSSLYRLSHNFCLTKHSNSKKMKLPFCSVLAVLATSQVVQYVSAHDVSRSTMSVFATMFKEANTTVKKIEDKLRPPKRKEAHC